MLSEGRKLALHATLRSSPPSIEINLASCLKHLKSLQAYFMEHFTKSAKMLWLLIINRLEKSQRRIYLKSNKEDFSIESMIGLLKNLINLSNVFQAKQMANQFCCSMILTCSLSRSILKQALNLY